MLCAVYSTYGMFYFWGQRAWEAPVVVPVVLNGSFGQELDLSPPSCSFESSLAVCRKFRRQENSNNVKLFPEFTSRGVPHFSLGRAQPFQGQKLGHIGFPKDSNSFRADASHTSKPQAGTFLVGEFVILFWRGNAAGVKRRQKTHEPFESHWSLSRRLDCCFVQISCSVNEVLHK